MKFMIVVKATAETEAGVMPDDSQLEEMGHYNQQLVNAGVMLAGEGLHPSSKGARIRFKGGETIVTVGPFTETRELIAGYTLIETRTREEAIDWVKRWPTMGHDDFELELRQVFTLDDFVQGRGIEVHRALAERMAKQPGSTAIHVSFAGNCREAFSHYAECLGGEVTSITTYGETPAAEEMPGMADKIAHAELAIGKLLLMGADALDDRYRRLQGFSLQLEINDVDRAETAFRDLSAGGEVQMPFAETFWAQRFGVAVDRFGVPWMINCGRK